MTGGGSTGTIGFRNAREAGLPVHLEALDPVVGNIVDVMGVVAPLFVLRQ
jgi:hypothetical protein